MNQDEAISRIEEAISLCERAAGTRDDGTASADPLRCEAGMVALALTEHTTGRESVYFAQIKTQIDKNGLGSWYAPTTILGVLRALKKAIQGGFLTTFKGEIQAELFTDFLERASELLANQHKDAAAVVAGIALEVHIRQLSMKHNIELSFEKNGDLVPKKASRLNDELVKSDTYSKLDGKHVTAWLDLRNLAAHGHYDGYGNEQVGLLIDGVRDFISRNRV